MEWTIPKNKNTRAKEIKRGLFRSNQGILINSDDTTYAFTATEEGAVFTLDDARGDNYPTLDDDEEEDDFDNEVYADDLSQSSLTYPGDAGDIGY